MTFEDFTESVVAGWVPVVWHSIVHGMIVAWKWVVFQVGIVVLARIRR